MRELCSRTDLFGSAAPSEQRKIMSTIQTQPKNLKQNIYGFFSWLTEWSLILLMAALTFSTALSEIAIGLALVSWLVKKSMDRDFSFLKDPIYLALTVFVAFVGLSVANSEHFYVSFRGLIKAVKGIVIFLILTDTFRTREQVLRLVKIMIGIFLFVAINGMWQYWFGKDLIRGKEAGFFNEDFRRRITASFSYYSQLGTFLILYTTFFISLLFGKTPLARKEKLLLVLLIGLGVLCLFHTASRASWLAFGGAVLFLGVIRRSKKILGGLFLAGVLALFLIPNYMLIHFDLYGKEQSASERIMLWRRAADVIMAHPFLGCGINTYTLVHGKYDTVKDTRVIGYYAHNGYLQLAAEIGLLGLAAFLLFLILFFSKILRKARDIPDPLLGDTALGCLAGCFGFLCLVFVDTVLQSFQSGLLFWTFMGLSMAALRIGLGSESGLSFPLSRE